jgi:hypothetical protein
MHVGPLPNIECRHMKAKGSGPAQETVERKQPGMLASVRTQARRNALQVRDELVG